jgi:hypothetical protein
MNKAFSVYSRFGINGGSSSQDDHKRKSSPVPEKKNCRHDFSAEDSALDFFLLGKFQESANTSFFNVRPE